MDDRFAGMTTGPDREGVRSSTGIDLRAGRDDGIETVVDLAWER